MTAPNAIPDHASAPLLMQIKDCLCQELVKTILGPVCPDRCYVAWGQGLPVQDGCACDCTGGNGDAWVKLDGESPDFESGLGSSSSTSWTCPSSWISTVTFGVYRCVPIPEDDGVLPGSQITDTSLALASDKAALWRVVACCPALQDGVRVVGWQPIDNSGGCAGGQMTIQLPLAGVGCA